MAHVSWVIKASKLCNLRCRYCYEWEHLANRERIPLEGWRRIFTAMRDYAARLEARDGEAPQTHIIWHGGEVTLLPRDYVDAVQAVKAEVLGERAHVQRYYADSLQTNAYALSDATIEWIKRHRFGVGVSCDFVPGVRLSAGGRPTEETVLANVARLRAAGVPLGLIVVLAAHTLPRITEIHDYLVARCYPSMRVLPLFGGPASRPEGGYEATPDALVAGLERLFVHWIENGAHIEIAPLTDYLQVAIRRILGVDSARLNRRNTEPLFIVNTDGGLYLSDELYDPAMRLGNVFERSIDQIRTTPTYHASLAWSEQMQARHCDGCAYGRYCSTQPLFDSACQGTFEGRCAVAYRVQRSIEAYLRREGFDAVELKAMLREELFSEGAAGAASMAPTQYREIPVSDPAWARGLQSA